MPQHIRPFGFCCGTSSRPRNSAAAALLLQNLKLERRRPYRVEYAFRSAPFSHWPVESMLKTSSPKPSRNRVDLSTGDLARRWCKYFGKSIDEIESAMAKVGDNAETVSKELKNKRA